MFEFDADTAIARGGDSTFTARISDRWHTPFGPNGGYILAIAARALSAALPVPDPLTITGHFVRAPAEGDVEIAVEVLKTGRRHATGVARMSQGGSEILFALGTFADLAKTRGRALVLNEPPQLGSPEDGLDPMPEIPPELIPSIARRFEFRVRELPGFVKGRPSGRPAADTWIRFADGRAPDPLALVLLPDALFPTVFEVGELVSKTVEMTVHVRAVPSDGWLSMRVSARHLLGGYHEEDVEIWDSAGTLVAQARQLAMLAGD